MADLITRILLAITKRVPLPGKLKWKVGMRDEIAFWDGHMARNFLTTNPGGLSSEAIFRLDKNAPLQEKFTELLAQCTSDPIRILDVGCGPFSLIGKTMLGRTIELTAVDPLADAYIELQKKHNIIPAVVPQRCDGEQLHTMFEPESFDFVHANNCLDHSYDPIKAIQEMFTVLKPGCYMYLRHEVNVAVGAHYVGLHQWNFYPEEDKFWITNKNKSVNVCMDELFAGKADLSLSVVGKMMINVIKKH